jgi:hypothetical protein
MPLQIGYLDSNGHPRLKIHVSGSNAGSVLEVDAMIDTGFTGFLMLPVAQAIPLGMTLLGTGDYTIANGAKITNFLAKGTITLKPPPLPDTTTPPPAGLLDEESVEGIIVLAGSGALLGMEFLRSLDKLFIVGNVVLLVSHSLIAPLLAQFAPPKNPTAASATQI